jgi:hypothetical protein
MRARLQKYLPIFIIALLVQVLAPIGACWAAAVTASDPLSALEICHNGGADQPADPGGQQSAHGSGCSICCLASVSASIPAPTLAAFAAPYRELAPVVWQEQSLDLSAFRVGANAQARAPPFSS